MANLGAATPVTLVQDPSSGAMRTVTGDTFSAWPMSSLTGLGYSVGGAVTQITTIATGVTLNALSGQITTVASTLAALTSTGFIVTNSFAGAKDVIILSTTYAGAGTPCLQAIGTGTGSFTIALSNTHATNALNALLVINFAIIKCS